MPGRALLRVVPLAVALLLAACGGKSAPQPPAPVGPPPPNTLTPAELREGWELLFDGTTLGGWHTYGREGTTEGWRVADGAIVRDSAVGDLVSDLQYDAFELTLEWKVAPGANSGIFFWANEGTEWVYMNAPEMQVLDNAGDPDGKSPLTAAGALYGLYPAPLDAAKPAGEWNEVRIVTHGAKAEFWLNGVRTVDVNFDSKEMKEKIAASKFKDWESFGKSRRGHIALQEHGGTVWFHNLKIREFR